MEKPASVSQVDLVFCVDITRSMEPFIQAARAQLVQILSALRGSAGADLLVKLAQG